MLLKKSYNEDGIVPETSWLKKYIKIIEWLLESWICGRSQKKQHMDMSMDFSLQIRQIWICIIWL